MAEGRTVKIDFAWTPVTLGELPLDSRVAGNR